MSTVFEASYDELKKMEAERDAARAQRDHLAKGLISIALNSCCEGCQEAKKVAMATLDWHVIPDEQLASTEKE